jgi:23S rRNA (pseudouridine1915-N3)-methyltransferase
MRIRLLCVGKPRDGVAARLHDDYAGRLARLGVAYETDWVPDVKTGGRYSPEHAREREGRSLIERIPAGGTVVALDERGESLTSRRLAEVVERWATPRATLIVGGPSGLHSLVLERADVVWSLSPLTFPHELVRGLIAEQLYRAVAIRRGLPYAR